MRVLFVGATSPPGGESARRFGAAAGSRSAAGDAVEVHAPGRLSVAHVALSKLPGAMLRDLRSNSGRFDAVVVRVEADRPVRLARGGTPSPRALRRLSRALEGYAEVTLMLDAGAVLLDALTSDLVRELFVHATYIEVATAAERAALAAADPGLAMKCIATPTARSARNAPRHWATEGASASWADAQDEVRRKGVSTASQTSLLIDPQGTARPSVNGATVWLIRRVVGKTRGAVTKLLRP